MIVPPWSDLFRSHQERAEIERQFRAAQQAADWHNHVRTHSFDDSTIIEGTFTVVDEASDMTPEMWEVQPKLLEGK